jgi:hypothetical protein
MIELDEAIYFLMTTARYEIKVKGALEVHWMRDELEVALGYFNGRDDTVAVSIDERQQVFEGDDAKRLRVLGVLQKNSASKISAVSGSFLQPAK